MPVHQFVKVGGSEILADLIRSKLLSACVKSVSIQKRQNRYFCDPVDYIGMRIAARGAYDGYRISALQKLIKDRADVFAPSGFSAVALDVGANIGNHLAALAPLFDKILAFEPIPALAKVAEANCLLNGITNSEVFNFGLSDENSEASIFMDTDNYGGSNIGSRAPNNFKKVEISLRRGDDEILKVLNPTDRVTFIKMDVEGHEQIAISGLRKIMNVHRPVILFEAHSLDEIESIRNAICACAPYPFFYTFGSSTEFAPGRISAALHRVLSGMKFGLGDLDKLPPQGYFNIIASNIDIKN